MRSVVVAGKSEDEWSVPTGGKLTVKVSMRRERAQLWRTASMRAVSGMVTMLQRKSTTLREKRAMMSRTITSNMEFLQVKDIINNDIQRQPRKSITFKMGSGGEGSSKFTRVKYTPASLFPARPSIFKKASLGMDPSAESHTHHTRKNITWK